MSNDANITQFSIKRIVWWLIPIILTMILWCYAYFFPTKEMTLYAIQTIFLSTPPYICLLFPLYTILLFWRGWRWHCLWSFVFLVGVGVPDPGRGTGTQSLLVVNVNAFSGEEALLQTELSSFKDSFVIQVEQRIQSIPNMNRVGFDTINEGLRTSHYSDVYCAKECRADVTEQIGSQTISMPIALLRIPDPNSTHNICVLGIHAPPPLPVDATGMIPYIDHLDRYIAHGLIAEDWLVCHRGDVVLLMGDLNAVPGSFPYERLINMGLRDVRSWSGIWGATWPMEYFYLPIPIFRLDQILVGGGLELKGWEAVTISNSDHRGIRVWF